MDNNYIQRSHHIWITTVMSIIAVALVAIVSSINETLFRSYFGDLPPVLTAGAVCTAGLTAFYFLSKNYRFRIYRQDALKKASLHLLILCIPFMLAVSLADIFLGFPEDINVDLPLALLFYPAMGYIGQIALHIIPLLALLILSEALPDTVSRRSRILWSVIIAAGFEAIFQVGGLNALSSLKPLGYFVILHLFLFGLTEFYIYRKYDFVSMYLFRLVYYLSWHIVWAQLR